jgi:hypothetical protein
MGRFYSGVRDTESIPVLLIARDEQYIRFYVWHDFSRLRIPVSWQYMYLNNGAGEHAVSRAGDHKSNLDGLSVNLLAIFDGK